MSSKESNEMSPVERLHNDIRKHHENPRPEEDIAEMMKAIIDAEDINYDDMAGGWKHYFFLVS